MWNRLSPAMLGFAEILFRTVRVPVKELPAVFFSTSVSVTRPNAAINEEPVRAEYDSQHQRRRKQRSRDANTRERFTP